MIGFSKFKSCLKNNRSINIKNRHAFFKSDLGEIHNAKKGKAI